MALADEVQARYPANRLKQLTNPGNESAAAVNTTFLGYAVTDTQADFEVYAGVVYDPTDARHVQVACEGVIAKLYLRGETPGEKAQSLHDSYIERLKAVARVTGRDRLMPQTASQLTPTPEKTGSEVVRPWSDDANFDRNVAEPPD
jgi:hypothetical protein